MSKKVFCYIEPTNPNNACIDMEFDGMQNKKEGPDGMQNKR